MNIVYDPDVQEKELSEEEIKRIVALKPVHTSFSADEPELSDKLVQRMKSSEKETLATMQDADESRTIGPFSSIDDPTKALDAEEDIKAWERSQP